MSLYMVARYLKLSWQIKKVNLLAALQYPIALIFQIISMVFNDVALLLIWGIFFSRFSIVDGWTFADTLLILSFVWFGFTLVTLLANGVTEISDLVANGNLDSYLTVPCNPLWYICVSKANISDIGSLFLTIVMWWIANGYVFNGFLLFLLLAIICSINIFCFLLITQSLAFYFNNSQQVSQIMMNLLLYMVYIPQSVFSLPLKIITITIAPVYFVGTLPMQIYKSFSIQSFILLLCYTLVNWLVAVNFFNYGIKKYESGNLITIKI